MYTVILVDDERSLRESIKELVRWEENDFQLIGIAENGLDALQLMEEQGVPDLLITDIKMPIMSGIDLAKRVRQEYPTVKIVFLSGHDEFEYAIEGIKLNVVSYLLKPVSKVEIEECLFIIRKQLDEELQAANDLSRIRKDYYENIDLMKMSFLISLLTETYTNVTKKELKEFLPIYHLEFLENEKMLLTIQLLSEEKEKHTELIRFSLSNIIRKIVGKYVQAEVFIFSSNIICLIAGEPDVLEETKDIFTNEIAESSRKLLNQEVYIGVSEHYSNIFQTKKAYRSAIEALDYVHFYGRGHTSYAADIEIDHTKQRIFDELDESALLLAFKTSDEERVKKILNTCLEDTFSTGGDHFSLVQMILSIVYVNGMRALRESGGRADTRYGNWYHELFETFQYQDLPTIRKELFIFCVSIMTDIQQTRKEQSNSLVAKSLRYLEENFSDPELSLKSVSQYLSVSSSYFSAIFKKEVGKSFIEMLTEMKMNKAKDLVLTTNEKMFEIASQCGYIDQHYFSYSFKKHFGVSPTKMRRQNVGV